MQWLIRAADWWRTRLHTRTVDQDRDRLGIQDDGWQRLRQGYEESLPSIGAHRNGVGRRLCCRRIRACSRSVAIEIASQRQRGSRLDSRMPHIASRRINCRYRRAVKIALRAPFYPSTRPGRTCDIIRREHTTQGARRASSIGRRTRERFAPLGIAPCRD